MSVSISLVNNKKRKCLSGSVMMFNFQFLLLFFYIIDSMDSDYKSFLNYAFVSMCIVYTICVEICGPGWNKQKKFNEFIHKSLGKNFNA